MPLMVATSNHSKILLVHSLFFFYSVDQSLINEPVSYSSKSRASSFNLSKMNITLHSKALYSNGNNAYAKRNRFYQNE